VPQIPADYRPLKGSERTVRTGATRTGAADPNAIFAVSVRVRRRADAPALPDWAFGTVTARRGKPYLSREEFAARYGASEDDLAQIATFAAANGLSVVESSIPRRTIILKGTVAQMSKAFAVDLGTYETPDEKYRGREGPLYLPVTITDIVEGVFGLDNRKMLEPNIAKRGRAADAASTNGPAGMTVPQVAQLYNFPTWPATGQTIGLIEYNSSTSEQTVQAVQSYFDSLGMPTPSIVWVNIFNPGYSELAVAETQLDIAVAGSAAPGARLVVYNAPDNEGGYVDSISAVIYDSAHAPSVISISYGRAESEWSTMGIQNASALFQEAAVLGVTIFVASGDTGSQQYNVKDGTAHVQYPASDPYVTAVGGTSISNVSGSNFTEFMWKDFSYLPGATGGGISDVFTPPPWQSFARVPVSINNGQSGRGVPDIAANADAASGYVIYPSIPPSDFAGGPQGGTSAAAPLYAALVALLNAGLGESIGYLNPTLYAGPNYVFRDIADGQNNSWGGSPGYPCGPGWDACTGLGVVNGNALKYALQGGPDAVSLLLLTTPLSVS
jgi:kumamolisin